MLWAELKLRTNRKISQEQMAMFWGHQGKDTHV